MMYMLGERLNQLRKAKKLTQIDFAKIFDIANGTIGNWKSNARQPDYNTILKISEYFNVSVDYLFGREETPQGNFIPVLGYVRAGIPITAVEDVLDYEEISPEMASQGEHFALKIKGDSMEPRIADGDVVVRQQSDADNGDVAVVLVNGDEATVKKIKKQDIGISLIPLNPAYDIMFYNNEEIKLLPVQIIGKVVELRARF
ncbi:MAG: helix-turn-helix domain-containing protein [Ruminococcaceae bacterium]|nr:helix-turn-helix domain-containing protein [Oscillospiraceae bacterium]